MIQYYSVGKFRPIYGDVAQSVRALASHARSRGFESLHLYQRRNVPAGGWCVFTLVLREMKRTRTGRRSAESKKGASGTLFSPRVEVF